jgi:hypothetical protein
MSNWKISVKNYGLKNHKLFVHKNQSDLAKAVSSLYSKYLLLSLTFAVGRSQKSVDGDDLLLGTKVALNMLERVL